MNTKTKKKKEKNHNPCLIVASKCSIVVVFKMNEESFWVMVDATPNGKVIRASHFKQLHVNIFFVKALEQMPTGAKSTIGFTHNQGKELRRMRWRSLDHNHAFG